MSYGTQAAMPEHTAPNELLTFAKKHWPELTSEDFAIIGDSREKLVETVEAKYGVDRDIVERELLWHETTPQ
ncbi:hypothetical protein [Stratiformator vulcanicus]|uniref:Uncharacterized protein n=1 Tax=Stratiformator vulcanicus TaxID=2527980 RepID=A0A517QZM3_9PLAN|nr:hypothetical protein [Stratiformator vulcanicus]QDT37081.1 hypothetical protein Pan189_14480 [Stratiformator vulcanicus]